MSSRKRAFDFILDTIPYRHNINRFLPLLKQDATFCRVGVGKTLIYVAATHHSSLQYPDAMADPTFKTIQTVFSKTPPDAVIVEGVPPAQVSGFLEYARHCSAANYNLGSKNENHRAESAFAGYLAIQHGVPVYTGELSGRAEFSVLQRHEYSIQDYFAFWIMNYIPYEKPHEQLTEDKFRRMVDFVVQNNNRTLGTSVRFTAKDFAAWYAKHMHTPSNYLDLVVNDTSPYLPPRAPKTWLHAVSALIGEARDKNIVNTIKTVLQNHKRVLVVYGASHLDFEWTELVQFMGVPKKTKPF